VTNHGKNKESVREIDLHSPLNERSLPYVAFVPKDFGSGGPGSVLYLLHGLFGSRTNWEELTDLEEYVKDVGFLVICPEGADSWYTDRPEQDRHQFESYIFKELIPDVESRFSVEGTRAHRAIAGLSMGGYGALKAALHHPELFCFAASMSGAFDIRSFLENSGGRWDELYPSVQAAFSGRSREDLDAEDLFLLAERSADSEPLPDLYFDCGTGDDFIAMNRRLSRTFDRFAIGHVFEECEGGHDWEYWDRRVRTILRLAGDSFTS